MALAAISTHDAQAQRTPKSPAWVHESWSIADGLPVNSVNALLQSKSGYIWAATFDGLVRFDGVKFTVFNSANTPGLPSDRIIAITETHDGAIWLITEQRQLIRFSRGRFTHFDRTHGIDGQVNAIREDSSGTLWIGAEHGLGVIRNDRFAPVAADAIRASVTVIESDRDGSVWVGTDGGGVFHVADGRTRRVSAMASFDSAMVQALFVDSRRRLWVSTVDSVFQLRSGAESAADARRWLLGQQKFFELPATRSVGAYGVGGVVQFQDDGLVLRRARVGGYAAAAPVQVRGADSVWIALGRELLLNGRQVFTLDSLSGAADGHITDMMFDRDGGIWLGTEGMGLIRLRRSLFDVYGRAEGLRARNASVVVRDSTDGIWTGSTFTGLSHLSPDRRSVRNYAMVLGSPAIVGSLLMDGRSRLLVGLPDGIAACALPAMQCTRELIPPLQKLTNGWRGVFALHRTPTGRVLAGTARSVFERVNGSWRTLAGWRPLAAPARVFAESRDGALWVGMNGGGVVRCAAAQCRSITSADGMPSDVVRSLLIDREGWLWIGTEGRGLARLDTRRWPADDRAYKPRVANITVADGLFDPVVHQILDDGMGRLWMSSNRGIFWVRRADLMAFADGRAPRIRSTAYTERDGMRNREANGGFQPAGVLDVAGRLWFATQEGVVSIDPSTIPLEAPPPPVVIEQVSARARAISADTTTISLAASERDIEITYTALSFRETRNVRFRYRLDPYDAAWVDAGSRRTAFYTRVPPGQYTFRVAASQGSDRWSEQPVSVTLNVAPLFRETLLAKILLAMALALTGVAIARWRLQQLRQREVMLTALVHERTAALQENERELAAQNVKLAQLNQLRSKLFANLSHEFRTPLTLILGPLRSLLDGRHGTLGPTVREQAELMLRNGQRLLRLINQILDLARLQAGAVTITRQPIELLAFVRTVTQAFAPLADRQGIAVVFRSPLRALTIDADGEQLEKVLLNLLSNAVKFTATGGIVDVSVAIDDVEAVITVRDTGVGIAAADLPHVFERFYQVESENTRKYDGTGIGLALVKELAELHGGTITVTSEPGVGSCFAVRLPAATTQGGGAPREIMATANLDEMLALEAGEATEGELATEQSAGDRVTVLLVDDNADVRAYVRSVLAPDFHVLEAADGLAGLTLAREALPDLIVADVMMPELDGLGLASALKDDVMTDAIPVILLTARATAEDQIAGLAVGADAYVVKPFDPGVLSACVQNLLAQRRRLRDRFRLGEAPPPDSLPAEPSALDLRLRPVVQAHLVTPDFSPEALATAAGMSYHQLYRALRDELGTTPSRYIRTVRAEVAAEMLKQGAGSVTEVAYAVGFESLSYFRRAFRERFGSSPSEFLTTGR